MINYKIKFNEFYYSENYAKNIQKLVSDYELFKQRIFSEKCLEILQAQYPNSKLYLTHSATAALEIIAILLNITEGDEIIMPSFTHVATANAFVLQGAKPVFIDVEGETLGLDPRLVKEALSSKTKAIVAMHYGGMPCNIDNLQQIANEKNIPLIEDAATGFGAIHKEKHLGTFGEMSAISFDITKHISGVHGGLLLVNDKKYIARTDKIYHSGTNRTSFEENKTHYFEWVDKGSKFAIAENCASILHEHLVAKEKIIAQRNLVIHAYQKQLSKAGLSCFSSPNGHLFAINTKDKNERSELIAFLSKKGIQALFHYIPLHSSKFGTLKSNFISNDDITTKVSSSLVRLPVHIKLTEKDIEFVCESVKEFYSGL